LIDSFRGAYNSLGNQLDNFYEEVRFFEDKTMKIKTSLFSVFFLLSAHDAAFAGWGDNNYGYSGGHMMMGGGYMGYCTDFSHSLDFTFASGERSRSGS